MALPKISTNLLNQEFPKTKCSPFFLECWKGQKRINEDYVSVWQSDENSIYAVFGKIAILQPGNQRCLDGHGGTSAAEFASSILLPEILKCSASDLSENNLILTFDNVQKQLEKCVSDRSGTTAAVFIRLYYICKVYSN